MNVKIILSALFLAVLISGCVQKQEIPPGEQPAGEEIPFETLTKGEYSGYTEKANLVINDEKTFSEVWAKTFSIQTKSPKIPEVDFSTESVIAVFLGERSTGGYSIETKKIINERPCGLPTRGGAVSCVTPHFVVLINETSPSRGALVTQALTRPYHIVKIDKRILEGDEVEFKKLE